MIYQTVLPSSGPAQIIIFFEFTPPTSEDFNSTVPESLSVERKLKVNGNDISNSTSLVIRKKRIKRMVSANGSK